MMCTFPIHDLHRRQMRLACLCALLPAAVACGVFTGLDSGGSSVYVSATGLVLAPGDTVFVGAALERDHVFSYTPPYARTPIVTDQVWRSANPLVATVTNEGLVTAVALGRTALFVTVSGQTDSLTVAVAGPQIPTAHFEEIGVGSLHACGKYSDGGVACWGSVWSGELGDGRVRKMTSVVSPRRIAGIHAVQLSVGNHHSCTIDALGAVRCWGENLFSQVRPGDHLAAVGITKAQVPSTARVVAAGGDHTCVLTVDQRTWCWGRAFNGIQGIPTEVPFVQLSAGYDHSCGLTAAGAAYCFGANQFGQLGAGDLAAHSGVVAVATTAAFVSVSAGTGYTCGIDVLRRALCWGRGTSGTLGNGSEDVRTTPWPVALPAGVAQIDAGTAHTCAVMASEELYCWGRNFRGELGIGQIPTPTQTGDSMIFLVPQRIPSQEGFIQVAAGQDESTCGIARDLSASCWGTNLAGTLGIGRQTWYPGTQLPMRISPARVVAPE